MTCAIVEGMERDEIKMLLNASSPRMCTFGNPCYWLYPFFAVPKSLEGIE